MKDVDEDAGVDVEGVIADVVERYFSRKGRGTELNMRGVTSQGGR
jgi:hypothetical protein